MKRLFILAAAVSLTGCAAIAPAIAIVEAVAPTVHKVEIPATQALIIAHNAYQGAAAAATMAVKDGFIRGDKLALLAKYDNEAKALLDKADAGQSVAANSAGVMNLVTKMHTLIGG